MKNEKKSMHIAELCMPRISVPEPVCALLVFTEKGAPIVTRHALTIDKRGPRVGIGAPLHPDDASMLGALLNGQENTAHALLPAGLLSLSRWRMTWVTKPAVRPMWFRFGKGAPTQLLVPWPRLVLSVTKERLHVAAVKTRARPTENTVLYHAPVMNVGRDGSLCLGNARLPTDVSLDTRLGAEAVLCDTAFSHTNHNATLRLARGEDVSSSAHFRFWRSLAAEKTSRFPTRCLRPMGRRLGAFLAGLSQ